MWEHLPCPLLLCIAACAEPNERAASWRLVCRDVAAHLAQQPDPAPRITLSRPVPHHAFRARWGAPASVRSLTREQRCQLAELTARSGSLANLQLAVAAAGVSPHAHLRALKAAAASGHGDSCLWLLADLGGGDGGNLAALEKPTPRRIATKAAAAAGHIELCLELLRLPPLPPPPYPPSPPPAAGAFRTFEVREEDAFEAVEEDALRAAKAAAKAGRADVVHSLLDHLAAERPPDKPERPGDNNLKLLAGALRGLSLPQVQALARRIRCRRPDMLWRAAVGSPTPDWRDKAEWVQREYEWDPESVEHTDESLVWNLAGLGHEALAERLACPPLQHFPAEPSRALEKSVLAGSAAVLRRVLTAGAAELEPHQLDCARGYAAMYGRADALRELLRHGPQLNADSTVSLMDFALMVSNDSRSVSSTAAHREIAEWLMTEQLPRFAESLPTAGQGEVRAVAGLGSVAAMVRLEEMLQRQPHPGGAAAAGAAGGGGAGGAQLRLWTPLELVPAARSGCQEAVEWLVAERGVDPQQATQVPYAELACKGDLHMLRLLRGLGCPWRPGAADLAGALWARAAPATLRLMVEELGCPVDWDMATAVCSKRLPSAARLAGEDAAVRRCGGGGCGGGGATVRGGSGVGASSGSSSSGSSCPRSSSHVTSRSGATQCPVLCAVCGRVALTESPLRPVPERVSPVAQLQ